MEVFIILYFIAAFTIMFLYGRGNKITRERMGLLKAPPLLVIVLSFVPFLNFLLTLIGTVSFSVYFIDDDYKNRDYLLARKARKIRLSQKWYYISLNKWFNIKE